MSDVFISYSHADKDTARKIAVYLEETGYTVWWDDKLRAGDNFPPEIEEAINQAKCIIVIWSSDSITSHWVRAEATEGLQRKILVPLIIGNVQPPLEFRSIQYIDISKWLLDYRHPAGKELAASVARIVQKTLPQPQPSGTDDQLADLRRQLLLIKDYRDFRSGIYELEHYLSIHPYNTEARILLDEYKTAYRNSIPLASPAMATQTRPTKSAYRPARIRSLFGILIYAAATYGIYLLVHHFNGNVGQSILITAGIVVGIPLLLILGIWLFTR